MPTEPAAGELRTIMISLGPGPGAVRSKTRSASGGLGGGRGVPLEPPPYLPCSLSLRPSLSSPILSNLPACLPAYLIELEAVRSSPDSLGAFTDEHYCGPQAAATRGMHSDDTHSQMWVGSGLTSKARGPIYSNLHRDSNGKN
jgi:hypothetical protein